MSYQNILDKVNLPDDIAKLKSNELHILCDNIREKIINVVSQNGGHLASNLGAVELTVALFRVFGSADDKIIWDVGHQCYTHKILTGRKNLIHTIRTTGGLSGFPKRSESPYDAFNVGHSSTSISAALGIASAKEIQNLPGHTIAVIGDGALTGGLAYEGLNNAGRFKKNFIVVLNDNKMSISKNIGSMSSYLNKIRMLASYTKLKKKVKYKLNHMNTIGSTTGKVLSKTKSMMKNLLYDKNLFEDMGFKYYGPIDGHNLNELINAFDMAKHIDQPVIIHTVTIKGKGYSFAEKNPSSYHGVSKFNINTGESLPDSLTYSDVFGSKLCEIAKLNKKVCAITAAMKSGTGLKDFAKQYKNRFFDVGIAEEHAITFAAGLATTGLIPVVALYSTFLQRGYDQIIHDAAAQDLSLILAIDRAGIVGKDGETHQGIFDTAFLNSIPNVTIFAPTYFDEMSFMMQSAVDDFENVRAIRYPRGTEPYRPVDYISSPEAFDLYYTNEYTDHLIITYGRIFAEACKAQKILQEKNITTHILKLNIIKPIHMDALKKSLEYKNLFFFEEGIKIGGISETFLSQIAQMGFKGNSTIKAIDDQFVSHSDVEYALGQFKLTAEKIANTIERNVAI